MQRWRRFTDPERDDILTLARLGFSVKCITREVYGRATEQNLTRVRNRLRKDGVLLGDYRNGRTVPSKALIKRTLQPNRVRRTA